MLIYQFPITSTKYLISIEFPFHYQLMGVYGWGLKIKWLLT